VAGHAPPLQSLILQVFVPKFAALLLLPLLLPAVAVSSPACFHADLTVFGKETNRPETEIYGMARTRLGG